MGECKCIWDDENNLVAIHRKCPVHAESIDESAKLSAILKRYTIILSAISDGKYRCYLYPTGNSFFDGVKGTHDHEDPSKALIGALHDAERNVIKQERADVIQEIRQEGPRDKCL